ncbi:hypothetical protein PBI_ATRAXA_16 [Arthrobacter phage Atraxa]|uniref:Uncharacterized protein n=1 Tax=Arthrobacter phage Atraxa TaxID=2419947 RepID=A0A3G2KDC1_9CAUD|nr:hypothetical protein PP342_gp16 [Arthrobacter phage Atraxa]AYN56969.1 hypothetical protein PBI_ATRAXA_16 [Arthrobacter phage Atraxa]AYN59077.1 hypothetical protein PBI_SPUTNIK_16 [Arthrobacter phage Sputnik]
MNAGKVGTVTVASTSGSVVGYSAAVVVVWVLSLIPVDAEPIRDALGVLFTAAGGLLGGKLVPGGGGGRRVAGDDE